MWEFQLQITAQTYHKACASSQPMQTISPSQCGSSKLIQSITKHVWHSVRKQKNPTVPFFFFFLVMLLSCVTYFLKYPRWAVHFRCATSGVMLQQCCSLVHVLHSQEIIYCNLFALGKLRLLADGSECIIPFQASILPLSFSCVISSYLPKSRFAQLDSKFVFLVDMWEHF